MRSSFLFRAVAASLLLLVPVALLAATFRPTEGEPASRVTVRRSADVEKQVFPWGWIKWQINDQCDADAEMTLGVVYIKPHQVNPLHVHPNSAEYLHVIEGSCEHLVGTQWDTLKAGDTVRIPQDARHRAKTGDEACRAIIVYNTGKRQMVTVSDESAASESKQ